MYSLSVLSHPFLPDTQVVDCRGKMSSIMCFSHIVSVRTRDMLSYFMGCGNTASLPFVLSVVHNKKTFLVPCVWPAFSPSVKDGRLERRGRPHYSSWGWVGVEMNLFSTRGLRLLTHRFPTRLIGSPGVFIFYNLSRTKFVFQPRLPLHELTQVSWDLKNKRSQIFIGSPTLTTERTIWSSGSSQGVTLDSDTWMWTITVVSS